MSKPESSAISAIGIDVAKATLSVCFRRPKADESALTLRNTDADIRKKLLPHLDGFTGRIVMESTGHYHWRVALLLTEAGYKVFVVNPILAKQYTSSNIRKVKTDPADASGLARMAELADNLPRCFALTRETLDLRKKLSVIASITKQMQALKATQRQLTEGHEILRTGASKGEDALGATIKQLTKTADLLEDEFVKESAVLETDSTAAALIDGIPGVSPFVAHLVLHWLAVLPDITAKSWIGYAGLDVSSRESGSWHGRCRLTKRGNSFLRRRLYSAAWGATMSDENFQIYYKQMRADGRPHVEALLIIARKIVRIMFKLLETKKKYDPSLFTFGKKTKLTLDVAL
jgi:transposase